MRIENDDEFARALARLSDLVTWDRLADEVCELTLALARYDPVALEEGLPLKPGTSDPGTSRGPSES